MIQVTDQQKVAFAETILSRLDGVSLASISKSDLELTVFQAFLNAEAFSLHSPAFDVAQILMMPKSRVDSLTYRHLLSLKDQSALFAEMAERITFIGPGSSEDALVIAIDGAFFRDLFLSKLKSFHVHADWSFNKELLTIREPDFAKALSLISSIDGGSFAKATKTAMRNAKVKSFAENIPNIALELAKSGLECTLKSFITHYIG